MAQEEQSGGGQYRMWCFTLHADEEKGEHLSWPLATLESPPINWTGLKGFRYYKYQLERAPDTGKLHLQGYLCLKKHMRLGELKRVYSSRAHWERSRGTIDENEKYCSKAESRVIGPFESGDKPEGGQQAQKRKWAEVLALAQAGQTRNEILVAMPELAPCHRGIDALIETTRPLCATSREIKVFYIYGPTGVGKTHHALTRFPNAYLVRGAYVAGKSFDQYQWEDTIILDEWCPLEWPLTLMNSLLDKWKCPLQCRYQNKYAMWNTVVITSNVPPVDCYTACLPLQRESFMRRLHYQMELKERCEALDWDLQDGVRSPDIPNAPTPPPSPSSAPTPLLDYNGNPNGCNTPPLDELFQ